MCVRARACVCQGWARAREGVGVSRHTGCFCVSNCDTKWVHRVGTSLGISKGLMGPAHSHSLWVHDVWHSQSARVVSAPEPEPDWAAARPKAVAKIIFESMFCGVQSVGVKKFVRQLWIRCSCSEPCTRALPPCHAFVIDKSRSQPPCTRMIGRGGAAGRAGPDCGATTDGAFVQLLFPVFHLRRLNCPKPNHGRQWGRWSRAGRTGCAARPPWASAAHPRSPVLPRRWPLSKTDYKERGRFKRNSSERVCPANVCPPPMHGPPCVRFVHKGAAVGARLGNWEGQRLNPSEATSCPPAQL